MGEDKKQLKWVTYDLDSSRKKFKEFWSDYHSNRKLSDYDSLEIELQNQGESHWSAVERLIHPDDWGWLEKNLNDTAKEELAKFLLSLYDSPNGKIYPVLPQPFYCSGNPRKAKLIVVANNPGYDDRPFKNDLDSFRETQREHIERLSNVNVSDSVPWDRDDDNYYAKKLIKVPTSTPILPTLQNSKGEYTSMACWADCVPYQSKNGSAKFMGRVLRFCEKEDDVKKWLPSILVLFDLLYALLTDDSASRLIVFRSIRWLRIFHKYIVHYRGDSDVANKEALVLFSSAQNISVTYNNMRKVKWASDSVRKSKEKYSPEELKAQLGIGNN